MDLYDHYIKRKKEIDSVRTQAFCSSNHSTQLMGLPSRPLTLGAWVDLTVVDNGVLEGIGDYHSIYQYLVRNHIDYPLGILKREWIAIKLKWYIRFNPDKLRDDLINHHSNAFSSYPRSMNKVLGNKSDKIPPVSQFSFIVDEVCHRYGWTLDYIREQPLNQLFQLMTIHRIAKIENYNPGESEELEAIKLEYLKSKNHGK